MPLSARVIIFTMGIGLFFVVLELVRKKRFREELSIIWLFFSLIIASGSLIDIVLDPLAQWLDISYPPALAFITISTVLIVSLLYFSINTSDLKSKIKELTQKVAMLEFELHEQSRQKKGQRQ